MSVKVKFELKIIMPDFPEIKKPKIDAITA
jgi:hypothetical protein